MKFRNTVETKSESEIFYDNGGGIMSDQQHCPGFESNKSLNAVQMKCPECGKAVEVFSDEFEKMTKCPSCNASFDPKTATKID